MPGLYQQSYYAESGYLKQFLGVLGMTDVPGSLAGGSGAIDPGKVWLEEFLARLEEKIAALFT